VRRRLLADAAARRAAARGLRALAQAPGADGGAEQPAYEGSLYVVASRGLQLMSPDGQLDVDDVLVAGGAVQRAYDVMDAARDSGEGLGGWGGAAVGVGE
jgi:hypothetical protein